MRSKKLLAVVLGACRDNDLAARIREIALGS